MHALNKQVEKKVTYISYVVFFTRDILGQNERWREMERDGERERERGWILVQHIHASIVMFTQFMPCFLRMLSCLDVMKRNHT